MKLIRLDLLAKRGALFFFILFSFQAISLAQELYRCTDHSKHVFYQDQPCESGSNSRKVELDPELLTEQDLPGSRGNGWLWRAERVDRVIYLTGSIHFGTGDMYPLPRAVMDAFNSSDVLMVEADIREQNLAKHTQKLLLNGVLSDGSTLKDRLEQDDWVLLSKVLQEVNVPETVVMGQKPWLAALTLNTIGAQAAGLDPHLGVDRHFLELVGEEKRVVELEGIDNQIEMLESMPLAVQSVLLRQVLSNVQDGGQSFQKIRDAWKSGEIETLESLVKQEFSRESKAERLAEILLARRNRTMAAVIDSTTSNAGNYFVVVGAAHLVGEDSLPAMLVQRGFHVEKIGVR